MYDLICKGFSDLRRIEALHPTFRDTRSARPRLFRLLPFAPLFFVIACSGPEPVLYPNEHLSAVGQDRAEEDIEECQELAENYGAEAGDHSREVATSTAVGGTAGGATGAVGGAIVGSAGTGAAIGAATGATAGLLRGVFKGNKPSGTHVRFVERCLRDRGYEPIGWE